MEYFKRMTEFIEKYNACDMFDEKNWEFLGTCELEMAKAFLLDAPEMSVRVSKIILALKDVNGIKIKVE